MIEENILKQEENLEFSNEINTEKTAEITEETTEEIAKETLETVLDTQSTVEIDEFEEVANFEDELDMGEEFQENLINRLITEEDIEELKRNFPHLNDENVTVDSIRDEEFEKFYALGLSATEAYAAANATKIQDFFDKMTAKREQKSHLKSNVPRGVTAKSVYISASEMRTWRETFPQMSDEEIYKLYKQTM